MFLAVGGTLESVEDCGDESWHIANEPDEGVL